MRSAERCTRVDGYERACEAEGEGAVKQPNGRGWGEEGKGRRGLLLFHPSPKDGVIPAIWRQVEVLAHRFERLMSPAFESRLFTPFAELMSTPTTGSQTEWNA